MSDQINRNPRFKKNNSSNNTFRKRQNAKKESNDGLTRLNKHVANSGICSRREADKFIEAGLVSVNGKVITSMGYKVNKTDIRKGD